MTEPRRGNEAAWVATLLLVLLASSAASYVPLLALHMRWDSSAGALALTFGLRETGALLVAAFALRRYLGLGLRDLGVVRPRMPDVAIGFGAGIALTLIDAVIGHVLPRHDTSIVATAAAGPASARAAAIAVIALWSPFVQEVVFRGAVLRALRERLPNVESAAVSAVVFALVHAASGTASVVSAGIDGAVLAGLTIRRGSLTAAIVAHVVVNTAACSVLILRFVQGL